MIGKMFASFAMLPVYESSRINFVHQEELLLISLIDDDVYFRPLTIPNEIHRFIFNFLELSFDIAWMRVESSSKSIDIPTHRQSR